MTTGATSNTTTGQREQVLRGVRRGMLHSGGGGTAVNPVSVAGIRDNSEMPARLGRCPVGSPSNAVRSVTVAR